MGIVLSLNIQLEKESFYPGEKVKGVLSIIVPKPMRARKVQITFEGKEHTHVVRPGTLNFMRRRAFERYTEVYEEEYVIVVNTINVWEAPKGSLFGPCNERFPFEFQIPERALPSVITSSDNENGISYEIKAKIDRPRSIDSKAYCEVLVLPQAYETYSTDAIERSREDFDGKLLLLVHVDKGVYVPGENVTGKVVFRQEPSLQVQSVDISVVCTGSFTAEGVADAFRDEADAVHCEVDPLQRSYEWPFDLETPKGGRFSLHGQLIKRLWEVEVKVNLPRKKNKSVDVPLSFVPLRTPATPDQ